MTRQKVLLLYRQCIRLTYNVEGERNQKDMRLWVRQEFENQRHLKDKVLFSYILLLLFLMEAILLEKYEMVKYILKHVHMLIRM